MSVEACTCNPVPVTSDRWAGWELVDVVDADGRWHAVRKGTVVHKQALITPSAAWEAKAKTERDASAADRDNRKTKADRLAVLKNKGTVAMSAAEKDEALDLLLERNG